MPGPVEKRCPECGKVYPESERFCSLDGRPLTEPRAGEDPLVGRVLDGRYRIERLLGSGGMGVVYLATQLALERKVALKLLRRSRLGDAVAIKRFEREARAVSMLTSPHTVRLYDFGALGDGEHFMVMEFLEGVTLGAWLEARKDPPAIAEVVTVARGLTHALAEAHARGLVHRDLKPANLFVCSDRGEPPHVVVLDFGIAAHAETDTALTDPERQPGTPGFIAPEALSGAVVDARADVYAIGAVLYTLLTGAPPFARADTRETLRAQLVEDPAPLAEARPDAPDALRRVIMRAIARDPRLRPKDAGELRAELERALSGGASDAPTEDAVERAPSKPSSSPPSTPPSKDDSPMAEASAATTEAVATGDPQARGRDEGALVVMTRWLVPVALAAILGLAIVVAVTQRREDGRAPASSSASASSSAPSSASASSVAPMRPPLEPVKPIALEFFGHLQRHEFTALDAYLDERMLLAWPLDQRSRVMARLEEQLGLFGSMTGVRTGYEGETRVVYLELAFQAATADLKLAFDRDGHVITVLFTNVIPNSAGSASALPAASSSAGGR
ncbi:MAG: protein kinase [Polyangiaceae bacterium]